MFNKFSKNLLNYVEVSVRHCIVLIFGPFTKKVAYSYIDTPGYTLLLWVSFLREKLKTTCFIAIVDVFLSYVA